MQFSYSRVSCFKHCPYQFKLRYLDKRETIHDPEPNNALICGNAIHLGIEKSIEEALEFYKSQFYILNDLHIEEMMKIEYLVPKVKEILESVDIYSQERMILTKRFKGIIDLITINKDGTVDVLDFKYSNNIDNYLESGQLHIYKYFLEQQGFKVNKLGFIFIPKINIRRKKNEDTFEFRKRLICELNKSQIQIREVKYDSNKVIEFYSDMTDILTANEYQKDITRLCDWCEYKKYCIEGNDVDMLPKAERREVTKVKRKKIWIYGAPFSGKTYLANQFDMPLMLNTDGNVEFVDAPYIAIKDKVEVTGRITNRTHAWQVFKDVLLELEKGQHEFKTIVVDLTEDLLEYCRVAMYDKLGISHESDAGYGKGYDMIRTEFLSNIKKLLNLPYNIVLISHIDMSKELTKKSGDKITSIKPNINDKIATKLAGMVDIVLRAINDDGERILSLKSNEVVFGGGRLAFDVDEIPNTYEALMKLYENANEGLKDAKEVVEKTEKQQEAKDNNEELVKNEEKQQEAKDNNEELVKNEEKQQVEEETSRKRRRKSE